MKSLKLHKSNEKMYSMIDRVEAAVSGCIAANLNDVGEAIHKVQDRLKAECGGSWNCIIWRSKFARTAVKFKTPYAQYTGPGGLMIVIWQC